VLVRAAADPQETQAQNLTAGRALLAVDDRGGRSVVTRARATSPLKLLTPRNHGHAAWVYLASYGGGLLDGDALDVDVQLGPDACAMISTQSWTKVYRPREGSNRGASLALNACVKAGGTLLLLPDPVVCFAGARFEQLQRIDLEEGAGLVLVDWVGAGRRAAGERWQFAHYTSRLTVCRGGRLSFVDRCLLSPLHGSLPERLGRFNVLCTILVVGPTLASPVERVLALAAGGPAGRRSPMLFSVSRLQQGDGAVVRLAGESFEHVALRVRGILDFVPPLLGDDPWARKW
jgi:urease accessory protein